MTKLKLLFAIILIVFTQSCGSKAKNKQEVSGIIPEKEMISILCDVHVADGYHSVLIDSLGYKKINKLYKSVFAKHKTDSLTFTRSLIHYYKNPKQISSMYVQVDSILKKRIASLK